MLTIPWTMCLWKRVEALCHITERVARVFAHTRFQSPLQFFHITYLWQLVQILCFFRSVIYILAISTSSQGCVLSSSSLSEMVIYLLQFLIFSLCCVPFDICTTCVQAQRLFPPQPLKWLYWCNINASSFITSTLFLNLRRSLSREIQLAVCFGCIGIDLVTLEIEYPHLANRVPKLFFTLTRI